jgi:hypothetical protein
MTNLLDENRGSAVVEYGLFLTLIGLIVVGLFLSVPCAAQAESVTLTPTQVVFQWFQWYPKDFPNAAMLTTTKMRDGLSPKDWAATNNQLFKGLQFKYLYAKVMEEEHDGVTASVTLKVRLFKVNCEVRQVQRYRLKKVGRDWLIDGQEIQEERVIGRTV